MGLGHTAQRALRAVKRTYTKGGVGELQVAIAAQGSLESLRALREPMGSAIARALGPPAGAVTWVSATPFVPPRHLKPRGRHALAGQVQAELSSRGYPAAEVDVLPGLQGRYRFGTL